ncbi:tungstate transport system ATP-binding protein [Roseovarius nanhaiticus]|uniref:Tungstate transport system ATP-binding protein n=2 Tax=Roseovarius nanhaiticus TaxID=573024 RepID=A0A1N7GBD3_9RHOB|nr:tungstate transport system ATP-binding protein [Roseovarius nanhaiticus]SIS09852.1 tungstate transport system ATP-binding protein [Roseovarius nanhaiticus]
MVSALLPIRMCGGAVHRRGQRLIGPVDLEIAGGGITAVIGPNGAGKSTLLKALHGLERLSEGHINWSSPRAEALERQAFVFQTPVMLRRSVLDNLAFPLRLKGTSRGAARAAAADWCARIGLGGMERRAATVLSGGERQKLALARALITGPELLFLDEPSAALDGRATREIEALLALAAADGTRIVMATHDMGQARRLAREIWFLRGGMLHEAAPADTFFSGPKTEAARAFLAGDIVD